MDVVVCFVCEKCFGGAFALRIDEKSCKSCCPILHPFATGVGINLRPFEHADLTVRKLIV